MKPLTSAELNHIRQWVGSQRAYHPDQSPEVINLIERLVEVTADTPKHDYWREGDQAVSDVNYSNPSARAGWYVIYTNANGRREVALEWCFPTSGAAVARAVIMGAGFSALRWTGSEWANSPRASASQPPSRDVATDPAASSDGGGE